MSSVLRADSRSNDSLAAQCSNFKGGVVAAPVFEAATESESRFLGSLSDGPRDKESNREFSLVG